MKHMMEMDPVLANEWFVVMKSEELREDPKQVVIMGERVVVFRTRKGIYAFKDLCIHRGCALSIGKVADDNIVCPYHGWKFNSQGQCVDIPAQKKGTPIPLKAKAIKYLCEEKYGLVWVCIGDPQYPIPKFDEFSKEGYISYVNGPFKIKSSGPRIIENFLDFTHLMWVHQGILSETHYSEVPGYQVREIEGQLITDEVVIYEYESPPSREIVPVTYVKIAMRPLIGFLRKSTPSGEKNCIMLAAFPLDHETSIVYKIHAQNFNLQMDVSQISPANDIVMQQDIVILENVKPEELPLDLQVELSLKSDQMSIAYRKWLLALGVTMGTA
ncbi:aromatic ring-hydroxylating oxygenase subunit alpha [Paenibacillus rigui]|uniref:Rieske domain-containing protein n=1 Tax=Paenibacillus rigui TaxID=554312 RepID=A0A229UHK2_9BACL|nr:aromatic ring-hydroxylating dioxygenase subunit alpha [Paenibacillus rigui]OXM82907.1 hypothetical protein CF651_28250 [Paenibacillus rigui]